MSDQRVRVWDFSTRAIHWALIGLVAFSWWAHKTDHMDWHKLSGFAVAGLLVLRIYLGFFGTETSRFSNFLRGPRAAWRYMRGKDPAPAGHNPIGGWSVALMLLLLVAQVGLGLFATDEDGLESGPLARFIADDQSHLAGQLHTLNFDILLVVIVLHIVAVLLYLLGGRNLIGPMLTGRKELPSSVAAPALASFWTQAFGVVLAVATFLLLWRLDR